MVRSAIILIFFTTLCAESWAQRPTAFTVKYFGMTIHPYGDKTADLQPYKLDKDAHFVANFGLFIGYEKFFYKDLLSLKIIQAGFTDCSGGLAGITHIGIRMKMFELNEKHVFYFGIGPTMLYRQSWERFGSAYTSSGYFNDGRISGQNIQYRFIPYGCEVEWDYNINDKNAFSVGFTPGIPMALTLSVGWKHWLYKENFDYNRVYIPR